MNVPATQYATLQPPQGAGLKFAYPSGSRPLEGFTIKRGIGRGGFGEVYYATSDAGKEVALKLIRRNLDVELRGVTQCLNLKHPHLLSLYDIRQDEFGDSWVVMEYMAGESLEAVIERNPLGVAPEEAMRWMRGIAAAVVYLHDHGIVHRDLKPGNIFSDEGIIKVGDYGLSKFMSCSRRSGQTGSVGTVHYMAPEVANGRYGKEIDLYAMGVILYEMLTGRVPFEGESVGEVLMKHLTATPDLSGIEQPFREVVERSLAKDPKTRLSSAGEMIELLSAGQHVNNGAAPHVEVIPVMETPHSSAPVVIQDAPMATVPSAVGADEEPILHAVKATLHDVRTWWDSRSISGPQRMLLLIAALFVFINTIGIWLPALMFGLIFYGGYRVVRAVVLALSSSPPPPAPPLARRDPAAERPRPAKHRAPDAGSRTLCRWRDPAPAMPAKSSREKTTELLSSLLVAAGVSTVAALVALILRGQRFEMNQFAFLALVGTLGAWAVLVPAKFWEGTRGETALRRFVMMVFGFAIGGAASRAMVSLLVYLPYDMTDVSGPVPPYELPTGFYGPDGTPLLLAYLAYFGFLFLIPRWWKQADPARSTRLSLWSTAVCVFWAAALNVFWPFPQPWGIMLAATISIAVQLASPWSANARRLRHA